MPVGITSDGYTGNKPETPSIEKAQEANEKSKKKIKVGNTVKVNFSASKWTTGENISDWIKGNFDKVQQVEKDKLLLWNVFSRINTKDVELLIVKKTYYSKQVW